MKKINYFLLLVAALWSTTAVADVVFDETNFPDENFREAIADAYWDDYRIRLNDGDILTDEMLNYELWIAADGYGIQSVQGIEYLAGLYSAVFDMNSIEEIDLSNNHLLHDISLMRNPLRSINLSGCVLLEILYISQLYGQEGKLEGLDLSDCTYLQDLSISNEPIHALDLSNNRLITKLNLDDLPNLESLDLSTNTMIEELILDNLGDVELADLSSLKNLKTLTLINNPLLESINFYQPDYTNLDEMGLGIQSVMIQNNAELTSVDLSGQGVLTSISCTNNAKLTSLDLSECSSLAVLSIVSGNLHSVNLTDCSSLAGASLNNNQINHIVLSGCESLKQLYAKDNNLHEIDITGAPILNNLNLSNNSINDLDFIIGLSESQLNSLDISYNPFEELHIDGSEYSTMNNHLTRLYVGFDSITTSINVKNFSNLRNIIISQYHDNALVTAKFNVSNCSLLDTIMADASKIHEINFSECPNISFLQLSNCNLELIDVTGLSKLEWLACERNKLKKIDGLESCKSTLKLLSLFSNDLTSLNFNLSDFLSFEELVWGNNHFNAIDFSDIHASIHYGALLSTNYLDGRQIQVYQTDVNGEKQFFIPLATTASHKGIKDLIEQENNFEDEDTGFDWTNVVTESITGATLGEFDGEAVLWLDKTTTGGTEGLHRMTYEYLTDCPNANFATVQFYLDWAEATTLRGDVNGDSEVDINDVTLLIDVILGKSVEYNATAADCNTASGDGTIDINDVTALINYVLAGNW